MARDTKHYDFHQIAALNVRGTATRDAVGGVSYAYTSANFWCSAATLYETGNEFFTGYVGLQLKDIEMLIARDDFTATPVDTVTYNALTYEIVDVIKPPRSGIQKILIRRLK